MLQVVQYDVKLARIDSVGADRAVQADANVVNIFCLDSDLVNKHLHLAVAFLSLYVLQLNVHVQDVWKTALLICEELTETANQTSQSESVGIVDLAHHLEVVLGSLYDLHRSFPLTSGEDGVDDLLGQSSILQLILELLCVLIDAHADFSEALLALRQQVGDPLDLALELRAQDRDLGGAELLAIRVDLSLEIQRLVRIGGMVIMRYLTKIDHAEVDELELIMLSDHQVQGTNVVVDEFLILGKLLYHVDGLQEDVQKLFVAVEQLLALASIGRVVGSHVSGRALVVLVDEVFQGQLGVEHATVLSFFDGNVVQEPAGSANELAVCALCDLEQLFLDVELVVEPLASEVLLQLTLKDQIKDSFLRLHPWYLQ